MKRVSSKNSRIARSSFPGTSPTTFHASSKPKVSAANWSHLCPNRACSRSAPMTAGHAQDKDKEIAFFDAHAEHDAYDVFTPQANERIIAAFMRLSGLPRGARVADLGCGSGVFTELLRH